MQGNCVRFSNFPLDVTQNFDYIFWCGDLNFRLLQSRDNVMQWIQEQNFPLTSPSKSPLADQLTNNIIDGKLMVPLSLQMQ